MDGFIKNNDLLEEKSNTKDLLDFEDISKNFYKKISSIQKTSVVALIGPFGTGKSTMLNQLIINHDEDELWIEFDAWKFPERKDLWEGFILNTVKAIDPKESEKVVKEIEGSQNDDKKTLIQTISRVPGLSVLEGLNHFFETSPAKHVDDMQKILKKYLEGINKNLFVIIEDVDRSGDAGIFFLETLKQFLRNYDFDKKVIAIIPMANDNYHKNIDSYLKSIDYFEFFEQKEINLEKFINEVFDDDLFAGQFNRIGDNRLIWTGINRKTQTISFLEGLFHEMPNMNMRLLKLIIRKANLVYKNENTDGHEPDFRIVLCLEAAKYFNISDSANISFFDDYRKKGIIINGSIFYSFLFTILTNQKSIYKIGYKGDKEIKSLMTSNKNFKLIERINNDKSSYPSYPWTYHDYDEEGYGLASFYVKY